MSNTRLSKLLLGIPLKYLTLLFPIFLLCTSLLSAGSKDYTIIPDKDVLPILTPSLSEQKTLKIRLNNGLEAYIISNPDTDQSAAALLVEVGSWEEPEAIPGLAHFVEHMLFLGTKKYPVENSFSKFITNHAGQNNAMTSDTATTYLFSSNNSAFEEALDRFSSFFISPLFSSSGVARELKAVDQEYAKNLENDVWRQYMLEKSLSNPLHPFSRFGIGNKETLEGIDPNVLREWYQEHYSANRMHLVVYSSLPIETLQEMVIADFKDVPSHKLPDAPPYLTLGDEQLYGHVAYIKPIKETRNIEITWELPPEFAHLKKGRPDELSSFVIGHEGVGSLLSALKNEGLALGLGASSRLLGKDNQVFQISISLTEKGLEQRDLVIERCYQSIARLKKEGIPDYLFDEVKRMNQLDYQYQSRGEVYHIVSAHARALVDEELETYPMNTSIIEKCSPKLLKRFLDELTPRRAWIVVTAPPDEVHVRLDRKEKWLGAEYTIAPIPSETLRTWEHALPIASITLPPPNPYIPYDLTLVENLSSADQKLDSLYTPTLLAQDQQGIAYYKGDDLYFVPELSCSSLIKTPYTEAKDAKSEVLIQLFIVAANEALNSTRYTAQMAGLSFNLSSFDGKGLLVQVDGYSDKALLLYSKLLEQVATLKTDIEKFTIYQDELLRIYENELKESPLDLGMTELSRVIRKGFTPVQDKIQAIQKITYQDFMDFYAKLFDQVYFECLYYGNLTPDDAQFYWQQLRSTFNAPAYPPEQHYVKSVLRLNNAQGPFSISKLTERQGNAAVLLIDEGRYSFKTRAAQQVLSQAISPPFFKALRTDQQTGYLVFSFAQELERQLFEVFAVQSSTHSPQDLLSRFELFLETFLRNLEKDVPLQDFDKLKLSLITKLQQTPANVSEMANQIFFLAFTLDAAFDWIQERVKGIETLSYAEFISLTRSVLGQENHKRIAILVDGDTDETQSFSYKHVDLDKLRSESTFMNRYEFK